MSRIKHVSRKGYFYLYVRGIDAISYSDEETERFCIGTKLFAKGMLFTQDLF